MIQKLELLNKLIKAADVRSIVTMLSLPASLFLGAGILGDAAGDGITPFLLLFGVPSVVAWLMNVIYCRPAVRCPQCNASLWDCGTGNFKPRHMKIRDDAKECPGCRSPIG